MMPLPVRFNVPVTVMGGSCGTTLIFTVIALVCGSKLTISNPLRVEVALRISRPSAVVYFCAVPPRLEKDSMRSEPKSGTQTVPSLASILKSLPT